MTAVLMRRVNHSHITACAGELSSMLTDTAIHDDVPPPLALWPGRGRSVIDLSSVLTADPHRCARGGG